jgi:hypothetical protein
LVVSGGVAGDAPGFTAPGEGLSTGGVAGLGGGAAEDSDGWVAVAGDDVVADLSAQAPGRAPHHQSIEAPCFGEAFM